MCKTALITGAAGGIGRQLCSDFSDSGYAVIALDRRDDEDIVCETFQKIDVDRDFRDIAEGQIQIEIIRQALDGRGLNVLINNAAHQVVANVEQLSRADWEETLNTNLSAPFFLSKELIPDLEKVHGSIINMASVHATLTKPGFVAYSVSKSALIGLTKALAIELGGRVRVNAISPGAVDTPMLREGFVDNPELFRSLSEVHPIGRIANTKEIACVALFLASDEASFITGANIAVDGGITSRLHDPA